MQYSDKELLDLEASLEEVGHETLSNFGLLKPIGTRGYKGFIAKMSVETAAKLMKDRRVLFVEKIEIDGNRRNPKCPPHCKWSIVWGFCLCK